MTEYKFSRQLVNRLLMPEKHVVICEDDIHQQVRVAALFEALFGPQHRVQLTLCPGAMMAFAVILVGQTDVVLLDHDMPYGSGIDLLVNLKKAQDQHKDDPDKLSSISPVILTFSGIQSNNDRLMEAGAHHKFQKDDLINGAANDLLFKYLGAP